MAPMRGLVSVGLAALVAPRTVQASTCPAGTPVTAFFAGEVDLGSGNQACTPQMEQCYYGGSIAGGPDAAGNYMLNWEDGDENHQQVVHNYVRRVSNGETCGAQEQKAPPQAAPEDEDDNWTPPEIPCTLLPRFHWEGSDPAWNKEAVDSLKSQFKPDEVIDGFDWHVILRFNDVSMCEKAYNNLEGVLKQCTEQDQEKCHTHKYVKAIEYVGDDPATRRKTGRHIHVPQPEGNKRTEL